MYYTVEYAVAVYIIVHFAILQTVQVALYFENNWSINGGGAVYLSSISECIGIANLPGLSPLATGASAASLFPFLSLIKFKYVNPHVHYGTFLYTVY